MDNMWTNEMLFTIMEVMISEPLSIIFLYNAYF